MAHVTAQAVLRTPEGSSVLEEPPGEQTEERLVPKDHVDAACAELRAMGFAIAETGAATISISGDRTLFEETFGVELTPEPGRATDMTYWHPSRDPEISEALRRWVSSVVFPIEPELYGQSFEAG